MPKKKKALTEEDVFGKNPMLKALDKQDITVDDLAKKLRAELDSKETKFFAHQGEVIQQEDVINWATRQKARMDAHKLRGDYQYYFITNWFVEGSIGIAPRKVWWGDC